MKLFLDTADIQEVREIKAWGVLGGVTTNPSLCARVGRDPIQVVKEILAEVEGPVSVEAVSLETEAIVEEARYLASLAPNVVVKIPVTPEGLAATSRLASEGVKVNMTLCFSVNQALLAAEAGATYVSPFLGRLDDVGWEGMGLLRDVVAVLRTQGYGTMVIAASLRHPLHVAEAARAGADVATMPFEVFQKLVRHPLTDLGVKRFLEDWEELHRSLGRKL